MRLAQLARKISVTPAEIVRFLTAKGESVADVNTRLTEQQLRAILSHLAPGRVEEILAQDKNNTESEQQEIVQVEQEVVTKTEDTLSIQAEPLIEETQKPPLQPENTEEITQEGEETKDPFEGVDLIKAPKVTLTGLKVVGKIDLPEHKKKEPEIKPTDEIESEIKEAVVPAPVSKKLGKGNNKFSERRERSERPRRNPVALQREREAREAEERKKEEIRREKERRTQYYNSRVKQGAPKRAARLIDEPLEALHDIKEEPKTIWGKIWRWLTT